MNNFCIICKEMSDKRYEVILRDSKIKFSIKGFLCKEYYDNLHKSHENKGMFKVYEFLAWMKKGKLDFFRL